MTQIKGYSSFCQFASQRTFSLIGLGVSNLPLVSFLLSCGAKQVTVRDLKKDRNDPSVQKANEFGAKVVLGEGYLNDLTEDVIIRSPGIRPDREEFEKAKQNGALVVCETGLFFRYAPCRSIAVTGSDGKTTTTTLIAKILEEDGWCVHLGGNIGRSMLPQLKECERERSISVTELSSFQLMDQEYSPEISVITNLSENHLDWHLDMEEYLTAKKNILKFQNDQCVSVLNADNPFTKQCDVNGERRDFSYRDTSIINGAFFADGQIYYRNAEKTVAVLDTKEIILPGKHNIENYMAAISAVWGLVSVESIQKVARSFGGVEHRIEFVRERDGVRYYNSSIDSSPTRSTACLRAFEQKIIMIAGGYDKNLDYTALGKEICEKVKILILCGATAKKIRSATMEAGKQMPMPEIFEFDSFDEAVKKSAEVSTKNDIVVLSPASASFDRFKNFEERGKYYKKLVMEL